MPPVPYLASCPAQVRWVRGGGRASVVSGVVVKHASISYARPIAQSALLFHSILFQYIPFQSKQFHNAVCPFPLWSVQPLQSFPSPASNVCALHCCRGFYTLVTNALSVVNHAAQRPLVLAPRNTTGCRLVFQVSRTSCAQRRTEGRQLSSVTAPRYQGCAK